MLDRKEKDELLLRGKLQDSLPVPYLSVQSWILLHPILINTQSSRYSPTSFLIYFLSLRENVQFISVNLQYKILLHICNVILASITLELILNCCFSLFIYFDLISFYQCPTSWFSGLRHCALVPGHGSRAGSSPYRN